MKNDLLLLVSKIKIANYFITSECTQEGKILPKDIGIFLTEKAKLIANGAKGRKFVYAQNGWRIIFTFFPTTERVNEKYALKNKVMIKKNL